MIARVITVNDVLDGHVVLDIECLDRIYLNAYVPIMQASSQVVAFLVRAPGVPVPLPGAVPPDGVPLPPGGGLFRRCQRHPVDQVR
jgi:hypothetical protein